MVDPASMIMWIQVGGKMIELGKTTAQAIKGLFGGEDPAADTAKLAELDRLYAAAIDVSRREAEQD